MCARPNFPLLLLGSVLLIDCGSGPDPRPPEASQASPTADLVLIGGAVETLDAALPTATALAIKGGKIARVGSDEEIKRWIASDTKVIELGGRAVVPGLVDSHMHLVGLGLRRFGIDLVGTASLDEVRARVKTAVAAAKPGEWIQGRGWDQNDWEAFKKKGLKFPTAKDLDEVSPNNPVVLHRIDGHAIWANSKAMALAGVDAKTKARSGGEIVKANGKPTGVFVDNAEGIITDKVPPPSKEQLEQAIALAIKECLSAGLVQVHDMGIGAAALEVLKELDARGQLKLRLYVMLDGSAADLGAWMSQGPTLPASSASRLTVRGVKFYMDGALGSRGAALHAPYSDDKKNVGMLVTMPDVLEDRIKSAAAAGYQVATHAIGDRGNTIVLDIYERVFAGDAALKARPRIEHAQILRPADIPRFGRAGVIASMQPTHATSDMPWAEKRVGEERLAGAYAWDALLTTGATIAAGSDAPVEDISPVLGLYAATTRTDAFGAPTGGWLPDQKMSPRAALVSFTRAAAYASFREASAGMIKEGFDADLTVLDRDPLVIAAEEMSALEASMTIIEGEIVWSKGTATSTRS